MWTIEGQYIKVGLIIDDRADDAQTDAIGAIASGAAGGSMANLAPLVSEVAGIEKRSIAFSGEGMNFAVKAGNLVEQVIEGIPSMADPSVPICIDNAAHPANKHLALAKAVKSAFNAFGIKWNDQTGSRNGHFAQFSWTA